MSPQTLSLLDLICLFFPLRNPTRFRQQASAVSVSANSKDVVATRVGNNTGETGKSTAASDTLVLMG